MQSNRIQNRTTNLDRFIPRLSPSGPANPTAAVAAEKQHLSWAAWWSASSAAGGRRDARRWRSSQGSASATSSGVIIVSPPPSPSKWTRPRRPPAWPPPAAPAVRWEATASKHSDSKLGGGEGTAASSAADAISAGEGAPALRWLVGPPNHGEKHLVRVLGWA
jgi:hypothetical protein